MPSTPCAFLTGALKDACEKAQTTVPGGSNSSPGGIISGPGSDWWRQAMFRVVEVVVGVAMVIAAVKALTSSSATVKVVSQGVKKVAKST